MLAYLLFCWSEKPIFKALPRVFTSTTLILLNFQIFTVLMGLKRLPFLCVINYG